MKQSLACANQEKTREMAAGIFYAHPDPAYNDVISGRHILIGWKFGKNWDCVFVAKCGEPFKRSDSRFRNWLLDPMSKKLGLNHRINSVFVDNRF